MQEIRNILELLRGFSKPIFFRLTMQKNMLLIIILITIGTTLLFYKMSYGASPELVTPTPNTQLGSDTVTFSWSPGSYSDFYFDVGTTYGEDDIFSEYVPGTSITVSGLPTDGSPIYVTLYYWTGVDLQYVGPYSYKANGSGAALPELVTPTPNTQLGSDTVTFSWSPGSYSDFYFDVGTTYGEDDIFSEYVPGTSIIISGLPTDGSPIYVTLYYFTGVDLQYVGPYSYKAKGSGAALPELVTPTPNTQLGSDTVTFSWSPGSYSEFYFDVGTTYGEDDIFSEYVPGTSITVSGLPVDGSPVYVTLYYLTGVDMQHVEPYGYKAYGSRADLPGLPCDVNNSGTLDLHDVILALQVLNQISPLPSEINKEADINGDNKIGLEEVIYALQLIARIRPHPSIDQDGDSYTANQGDCDDENAAIYPGAIETCGDGIDQNCSDCDQPCPSGVMYANETFDSEPDGFYEHGPFFVSESRFVFRGDRSEMVEFTFWNGGDNPSNNWHPSPIHSNYFDEFNISVNTYWDGGSEDHSYGLIICISENSFGDADFIGFDIMKKGDYTIYRYKNDNFKSIVSWKRSFLRSFNGEGTSLSIEKEGNNFRFFIGDIEIERLYIDGFPGGGVGISASHPLDTSFDNFKVVAPLKPSCPSLRFPIYSVEEQNEFIYKVMTSSYFWHNEVPQIDYRDYSSPEKLLEKMQYKELDRWSYITSKEEHRDYFEEGKYIGLGFGLKYDTTGGCHINFVYKNSPSYVADLMRGDKILKINGKNINEIENNSLWDTIFGPDDVGVMVTLVVENSEGVVRELNIEKDWIIINSVLHYDILETNGIKIGYLVLNKFLETSRAELAAVFAHFNSEGIDELILDLRYNEGGRGSIAQYLSGLIAGDNVAGKIFLKYIHNETYTDWNSESNFVKPENALSMNKVVIITTGSTCSASELVINSLKPFIDVVLVGDTTCGKPVGMYGYNFGDNHISPIEFKTLNAINEGDYFDGIPPICHSNDDLSKPFGDTQEDSLKEALYYIANGTCTTGILRKLPRLHKEIGLKGFRREISAF